jgi:branched-subunit amino acid transport protein
MSATLTFWTVVVAAGAVTYFSRLSFIALFARRAMPTLLVRALRYVPAAMLTSIVVPAIALTGAPGAGLAVDPAKLIAAIAAALIAWRTRSGAATMGGGMLALWAAQWLLGALSSSRIG